LRIRFCHRTQNPVEHHGTYPLPRVATRSFPHAQSKWVILDETEKEILRKTRNDDRCNRVKPVADVKEVFHAGAVTHIKVDSSCRTNALDIVNRTRKSDQLALGVSPRGTLKCSSVRPQARAFLDGRDFCSRRF